MDFESWKAQLSTQLRQLSKPIPVKVRVEVGVQPKGFDLTPYLIEFAQEFMEKVYVKQYIIPLFYKMGLPDNPYPFMPHIEIGAGAPSGHITYERHKGHSKAAIETTHFDALRKLEGRIAKAKTPETRRRLIQERDKLAAAQIRRERAKEERASEDVMELREEHNQNLHERMKAAHDAKMTPEDMIYKWKIGFKQLIETMTKVTKPTKEGTKIVVRMGPMKEILNQKLGDYRVTKGAASASEFDSFYYAEEFGTGIADNLGGRSPRVAGKTKTTYNGKAGYWWFGKPLGDGAWTGGLFSGQRGTHFWFDPKTGKPHSHFAEFIGDNIKDELSKFLRSRVRNSRVR